ncbi:MAG: tetratricopeptide repeat protein [Balneola sp.]
MSHFKVCSPVLGIFIGLLLSTAILAQNSIDQGVQLFEEGNTEEAKTFFEGFLKSNKKHAEANFYLGRIYFDEDEYGKATDWFKKAADYDSGNSKYHMWLGHSYGRSAQNAGKLKQAFYARDSRKNYEKSVELDPNNVEARESVMEFYLQAPGIMGGGRDKAENQAQAIMELDKEAGYVAWGRVFTYYEETDAAIANYTEAIENYPTLLSPYYQLYNLHFNNGNFEEAVNIAKKQLEQNDDDAAVIYLRLGNALQRDNQFDEAYSAYQTTLEMDSSLFGTWYQIGRLAAVSGQYLNEGEEYLIRFISKKDEYNANTLAWTYFRLGTIYEYKNSLEAAKDQYEMALKTDKDHSESKEALARLR